MYKPIQFAGEVCIVFPEVFLLGQCLLQLPLQLTNFLLHLTALYRAEEVNQHHSIIKAGEKIYIYIQTRM